MFRKSIVGSLAAGAVIAAAVIVLKVVESKKESAEKETPEEDNEIHFIEINGDDEEEEDGEEEEPEEEPHKPVFIKIEEDKEEPEEKKISEEKPQEPVFIKIEDAEEPKVEETPEQQHPSSPVSSIHIEGDDEEDEEDGIQIQSFPKDPVEVREDVKEVQELYPFLSAEFVEDVLEKNEELMKEYPEDTLVCVMHKMTFADLRTLLEFEMIMTDAGYICTQIDKEALEVSRRFFSEDGAVISDILNVANQVNALHGTYEGYVLD